MKASQFEQLPLHGREIVFLGDSITEGGAGTHRLHLNGDGYPTWVDLLRPPIGRQ